MKMMILKGLTVVGAAVALAGCAGDQQPVSLAGAGAQCFNPIDITAFYKLNDSEFVVHTVRGKVFKAQMPTCRGMDFAMTVALRPIRSTQSCDGDQATLITSDPGGRNMTCGAYSFHQLSDAEIAMLPAGARP